MELTLIREHDNHQNTIGMMYMDGVPFCMTLEDTFRHEKIKDETRIPSGRYEIKMRHGSPMSEKYRLKYGTDGMIWLQDVPGFQWVYIHIGNDERDSSGCILVGRSTTRLVVDGGTEQVLMKSTETYRQIHQHVSDAIQNNQPVFITIIDNT